MSIVYSTLLDAVGFPVTVETLDGTLYHGKLEAVDKVALNVRLTSALVTLPTGAKEAALEVTVPGAQQKCIRLPDNMKRAPRFADARKGGGGAGAGGSAAAGSLLAAIATKKRGAGRKHGPSNRSKAKRA